jgi:CubicO group peptidase (beta-lactamase class C family)
MNAEQRIRTKALAIFLLLLPAVASAQAPGARIDRIVQSYADAQQFMGAVLVARDGNVLLSKGYGSANLEWNTPNSPSTKFVLASITKQFTATSILLLEERGKLKTTDSVRKYLPDAPATWDDITIYNLLTHTSGIPDRLGDSAQHTPEQLFAEIRERPLKFRPGEQWDYSNSAYEVLGYMLEKITGESYKDFIQENIFTPLHMKDSGYDSNVDIIPRRASGYWPGIRGIENARTVDPSWVYSAGAIYSTTEDLLRWEESLFGGKVLKPESLEKLTTPFKNDYACGLIVHQINGQRVIEHGGNVWGFNAEMLFYPESKLNVIVLGNLNGRVPQMAMALGAAMHGETVPLAKVHKQIHLSKEVLQRYAGTYELSASWYLTVTAEDGYLLVQAPNQDKFAAFPESETSFFYKAFDAQFEFSKNDHEEYVYLTAHQEGKDTKMTKR